MKAELWQISGGRPDAGAVRFAAILQNHGSGRKA